MKHTLRYASISLLIVIGLCYTAYAEELSSTSELPIAYKVPPPLLPLQPGAVRPEGWLHDWARAACDGITGNLDTDDAIFRDSWKKDSKVGWPLEQCAYWLDGAVRLAYILDDKELIKKIKARLDPVVDGVLDGGASFIFWKPKTILKNTFNNWAHSHMGRALVAYYQATGDKRILDALIKVYREYPLPNMPTKVFEPVSGAVNLDPLLETYMISSDAKLLENALAYARREPFEKLVKDWANGKAPDGHSVIFYENIRVPALLYPFTGEKKHLEATLRSLEVKNQRHGLPIGLMSAEEYLAGFGSTRSTETCNVACGGWTYHWLLRITGQGVHADRMERIFFNAGPAPISRDFKLISYYQTPNRVGKVLPGEKTRCGGYEYSKLGNGPKCCVGNCNRIIPNFIMQMWMATVDGGLAATLYGPCKLETTVSSVPVSINVETIYPFDQSILMTVETATPISFPLHLRIPAWCNAPEIKVNKRPVSAKANEDGFVVINRKWTNKDSITLEFPMQATIITRRENKFPDTNRGVGKQSRYFNRPLSMRADVNEPVAYVTYGPLLFALAIPDETPNKSTDNAVWNYALDVDLNQVEKQIKVTYSEMPKHWSWQLTSAPIQLRIPARQFDWKPTGVQPMPKQPVEGGRPTTITLVPYGCTKYRISMFPVTAKTWRQGIPASSEILY